MCVYVCVLERVRGARKLICSADEAHDDDEADRIIVGQNTIFLHRVNCNIIYAGSELDARTLLCASRSSLSLPVLLLVITCRVLRCAIERDMDCLYPRSSTFLSVNKELSVSLFDDDDHRI